MQEEKTLLLITGLCIDWLVIPLSKPVNEVDLFEKMSAHTQKFQSKKVNVKQLSWPKKLIIGETSNLKNLKNLIIREKR